MRGKTKKHTRLWAVTLMELLVVVLIISILATIATGVYTGKTQEARVAAAHALIHNLEIAITRYEIDTGSLPPSGSGTDMPPVPLVAGSITRVNGSGYLHLALMHSMSGSASLPNSTLWKGPYINLQNDQVRLVRGDLTVAGTNDVMDPWGNPIVYCAWNDYGFLGPSFSGGTNLFTAAVPGANPALPAPNPYAATETYYNPRTFQVISFGPDGASLGVGATATGSANYTGAGRDDITNFGY